MPKNPKNQRDSLEVLIQQFEEAKTEQETLELKIKGIRTKIEEYVKEAPSDTAGTQKINAHGYSAYISTRTSTKFTENSVKLLKDLNIPNLIDIKEVPNEKVFVKLVQEEKIPKKLLEQVVQYTETKVFTIRKGNEENKS
jgi:hypothetical protein